MKKQKPRSAPRPNPLVKENAPRRYGRKAQPDYDDHGCRHCGAMKAVQG